MARRHLIILTAVGAFLGCGTEPRVTQTVTEPFQNYQLHGVARDDGSLQVVIATQQGRTLFQSDYPVYADGIAHLAWSYTGEQTFAVKMVVPPSTQPKLESMTTAARDIVKMIAAGGAPGSNTQIKYDTWGCTSPAELVVDSCSSNGNCCDTHDECYAANNCDYLSWSGLSSPACEDCNDCVVLCVTGLGTDCSYGYFNTNQSSTCCDYGNCGAERCTGTLNWNDPYCHPDGYGGIGWGGGEGTSHQPENQLPASEPWNGSWGWGYGIPTGTVTAVPCYHGVDLNTGQCLPAP
ncbi:MAG: hypothetical protein ACOZQL_25470 [Myxococcota bacterium]